MNVLVTKDDFGTQVWRPDTEVKYVVPFTQTGKEQKIWMKRHLFKGKRILNSKEVKRYFPELHNLLNVGDVRLIKLHAILT
jgi:hypothetical protein